MPDFVRPAYLKAIKSFPEVVLSKRGSSWDDRQMQAASAAIALGQGNTWFARTYYKLDRAMLHHMIQQEFGSAD
jgi:hypothetical protein